MQVDLLVPVKPLTQAKTRLWGATSGTGLASLTDAVEAHALLVLALVRDTLTAAADAATVRRVIVICSDDRVRTTLAEDGVETIPDEPATGLNSALRRGEAMLRATGSPMAIGALLADLPALRPAELDCALQAGLATGHRAFCTDRVGTGTTLLLAPPQLALNPQFGRGSAAAHRASGARPLLGCWPGLRCDIDTVADLVEAGNLGLGRFTRHALALTSR